MTSTISFTFKDTEYEIDSKHWNFIDTLLLQGFNGSNNELEDILESNNIDYYMWMINEL